MHFQWPEKYFSASNRIASFAKRVRFRIWMRLLRARGTAVVLTIHNLASHESHGAAANRELSRLERLVDRFVVLNPAVAITNLPAVADVIPHGNYRSLVPDRGLPDAESKRLLYFGFIRAYKNVPLLVSSFAAASLPNEGYELRVVGKPYDALTADAVRSAVADSPSRNISARLAALRDAELIDEISRASVIILPYADLYNSGALIMSLTIGRPVIVPRTPATEYYAEQFGPDWVYLFDLPLSPERLADVVKAAAAESERAARPDLSALDWEVIAAEYASTYRAAIADRAMSAG
ncbi:hypothetical protein [Microbacterium oleivorans]|uniref:Glycosyltransferase n=1 Tax=Microbacterium oleivorans TaxID=273677 RepID=A0A7D5JZE4_9MICO|nr:hypothetical protein [Microbacterium oleivorans]QLD12263.1 hypothetical protein HW566_11055 [Microbacterium oleivorans]